MYIPFVSESPRALPLEKPNTDKPASHLFSLFHISQSSSPNHLHRFEQDASRQHEQSISFFKQVAARLFSPRGTCPPTTSSTSVSGLHIRNPGMIITRDTPMQTQNATIGAVVGVSLTVFLAVLFYFVYRYHASIRLANKKRRRSHSSRSGTSRDSRSASDNGAVPPTTP
ncbi:hypothetical protein B0T26DRAFT_522891 [Lasiosphaeria miniovina]|uniref:Uncharacterized protein n=1 Tax=Lasiosphaeria miniovina TaxID=1954250 RepID=A0AA39ZUQ4_9PEZI|nr:uncharacterized protein B0T26DRAFT_522891 [Lasiosphaeria miniovina]KAK0704071.1 hypothetical protein B0T26DRAFT_522891 [Lasiosphaeria miniovina]